MAILDEVMAALWLFVNILFLPVRILLMEREENRRAEIIEKLWIESSFEFEGGRYNKEYYELVDGQIREKHGNT